MARKDKGQYVHVIDKKTRKSIEAVGPTTQAEKVARGMSINLNHDAYELSISDDKNVP